jgi:hypothetical protein
VVEAHEIYVLVQDALEETLNILHLQRHAVLTLKVCRDASNAAALILARLRNTTSIAVALTAATNRRAALNNLCPAILSLSTPDILVVVLVDQKLGTTDANTPENAKNLGQELDEEHRAC